MKRAVIILPTYNEAGNINRIIEEIFAQQVKIPSDWELHVLVVDDNSPDKTADAVKRMQVKQSRLHLITGKKQGLGKAYVKGFSHAIKELNAEVLFEMDADFSHPPTLIPKLLKGIIDGADFVIGTRYIKGGSIPSGWGLHRKVFSGLGNIIIQLGFMNFKIHDWTSGFRAIKSRVIENLIPQMPQYSGYVFQIALLDKVLKNKAVIKEIPLRFGERKKGVSKINAPEYIFNLLAYVIQNSSFIKYVFVGFAGFFIDFSIAYLIINFLNLNKALANSLSAEVAIVSNFFLNNFWVFKHKKIAGGALAYLRKFLLFNFVSSGSILIQGLGMWAATTLLGDFDLNLLGLKLQVWIIYKVFIIALLVIPYSYIMYNKIIWKD